jgi:nicotinate-nucleotide--dimethylbenzimidazole phosphoribosyltransferase
VTPSFADPGALSRHLANLPAPDAAHIATARARQATLTKPPGALGRLEDLAVFLAGWADDGVPRAERMEILIFAGNHGVTRHGISPYPAAITAQMVANFASGGAAINGIARANRLGLRVIPLSLEHPTGDIMVEAALSEAETLAALQAGAAAVDPATDILMLGEMGIGNTTIAAALAAAAVGGRGADWAGPGTGLDAAGVEHKARVIDSALARHPKARRSAFDALGCLGGRELAAIAGAILAARHRRMPVLIDGFVVTAALAVLAAEACGITAHCIAGHVSAEPAHRRLLDHLGLAPLLDLGMRLGEGSGAALASAIVRAAVATHTGMATFAEASLAARTEPRRE